MYNNTLKNVFVELISDLPIINFCSEQIINFPDKWITKKMPRVQSLQHQLMRRESLYQISLMTPKLIFKSFSSQRHITYKRFICKNNLNILGIYSSRQQTEQKQTKIFKQFKENIQQKDFESILQVLHGKTLNIKRDQIYQYYPIIRYLHIHKLQKIIEKDITKNINKYNIFSLLNMLFELCIVELETQSYNQLGTQKNDLNTLPSAIFKLIVKSHNKFKKRNKTQISYIQINEILKDYCEMNLPQNYHQLKYEVFDLTCLTSQQYKTIFLHQLVQNKEETSLLRRNSSFSLKSQNLIVQYSPYKIVTKSSLTNMNEQHHIKSAEQLKIQMIITFLTKKNEQLQRQNDFLSKQLQIIKDITTKNQQLHRQMSCDLNELKKQLQKKQRINQQNRKIIDKVQPQLNKLQQQIDKKTEQIQNLTKKQPKNIISEKVVQQITNVSQISEQNSIAQSQLLPASFLQQMFSGFSLGAKCPIPKKGVEISKEQQIKQQVVMQDLDDQDFKDIYSSRIQFDEQPSSIDKHEIIKLCKLITETGFTKKYLNLIYRRSRKNSPKGEKLSIRGKQSLLIILRTQHGQNVGGFISSNLPLQDRICQIPDKNAYLFSLSKNKKIKINSQCFHEAISLSDQYLLGFSSDLIISDNCIVEKNYCSWPKSYGCAKLRSKGSNWLTGGYQFLIEEIQIYQVAEGDMEMVI